MSKLLQTIALLLCTGLSLAEAPADAAALDAKVQQLKQDVLELSEQLSRIEQQLLYPADTHLNLFVSIPVRLEAALESAQLVIDDQRVASHVYTAEENRALQHGGVQRLYTGNVMPGEHRIQVELVVRTPTDERITLQDSLRFDKNEQAAFVELQLVSTADQPFDLRFLTE